MTIVPRARPTLYRGTQMRSRLEAKVAAWFDRFQIPWAYESQCFADEQGQYLPDFEIRDFGVAGRSKRPIYVEVKPTWPLADEWKERMEIIWSSQPTADLMIIAPGYLDFAFGVTEGEHPFTAEDYPNFMRTQWGNLTWGWIGTEGRWREDTEGRDLRATIPAEAGEFHRCAQCKQATLTIWADYFACARCGFYDGDHHLDPLIGGHSDSGPYGAHLPLEADR